MGKGGGCGASKAARVPSMSAQPVAQEEEDESFWHMYVSWTNEDEQSPERPVTMPPPNAAASSLTTGAVRLSYVLDFVTTRLPMGDPNMPTWSVALNLVQPATLDLGVPYTSLPEMAQHVLPYGTTKPYYFVSHAWSRPFREAVDMLAHHFRGCDPGGVYVWFDIFAIRQQSFTAAPTGPDMVLLEAALRNSAGVLLCLDEAGLALRRTWCLYEAWVGATAPAAGAPAAAAAAGQGAGATAEAKEAEETEPGLAAATDGAAGDAGGAAGNGNITAISAAVPPPQPLPQPPIGVTALTPRAMLPEERARLFSRIDIRQSRCKYKVDRDALLASARTAAGPGGLDAVNSMIRLALMLRPHVPEVYPELNLGRMIEVPELWDMSRVDQWLSLPQTSNFFPAMAIYGPACSGKTVATAAIARHLRMMGIPVAVHFCNVSDVRTLEPVAVVISLALQLAQAPGIGPRLLRQYGELPAGLFADLVSYNNTPLAVEAAVEALLVQPLQRLLQPDTDADGDPGANVVAAGAAKDDAAVTPSTVLPGGGGGGGGGRGWNENGDVGTLGGGCDEDLEGAGGGGRGLHAVGAKSLRAPTNWNGPPEVVVLIIDGVDQADGAIMGGSAPFDNQVLQLIQEHLPKLPSFVRCILTSRSLSYIIPRLAERFSPLEMAPDMLRPIGPFMRNVRLAIASIDPALGRRHRAAAAANLVTKSRGSMLYIKMALCCLELERDVAVAEAEADVMLAAVASLNGPGNSAAAAAAAAAAANPVQQDGVRRTLSRLASTKKQTSNHQLPSSLGGLLERYLTTRLRLLNSTELRNQAATVLAVLAAAREPLTPMQLAATVGVNSSGWYGTKTYAGAGAAARGMALLAAPPVATERMLQDFVVRGLGALVRLRGSPGSWAQEVLLVHSAVSEWLQRTPKPRVLLGGSVIVDLAAGNRALACYCRDDALSCLYRDHSQPYGYSLRHIFLHVGLAAMAASAAEAAAAAGEGSGGGGGGPMSPSSVATTTRSSGIAQLRSRSGTYSYNSTTAAVALAAALAAAAASADWIATLELLLQRLDLWTSIYTAGAGGAARWVVLALASLPMCSTPSADPGSTDSQLLMILAEARRWLLLYHSQLCWFPLAVVASAATLPEDSALRSRALEFSAGPDPWEYHQPPATTITVMPAHKRAATRSAAAQAPPPPPSAPPASNDGAATTTAAAAAAAAAAATLTDPLEAEHMLLLSTGDVWSCCTQTLRTGLGRVLHVAMQPAGRMVATVHDCERGVWLWDIWGAKPILAFAGCCEMGSNPTAAFFTPDGRKLVCAARSVFVWEVATGRRLLELHRVSPQRKGSGGTPLPPPGSVPPADPDGPITALALSPGGSRAAAGHANGTIRVWDLASGALLAATQVPHCRAVTALAFNIRGGETLVTAHGEGGDAAPKAQAPVAPEELGDVPTAFIKADELPIHVWRVHRSSLKELEVLKGHTGRVNTIVFSTHNRTMITGSADETIRTWWDDPKTPQSDYRQIFILGGVGQGVVHTIQFSPAPPPPPPPPSQQHTSRKSSSMAASLLMAAKASGSTNNADAAGNADGETPVVDFTAPSAPCLATAAFGTNADLPRVASGALTPDAASAGGGFPEVARGNVAAVAAAAVGGAGRGDDEDPSAEDILGDVPVMAYSCGNGIIRLWSPTRKRQIGLLRGLVGAVTSLSFSGDGRLLASADESDTGLVRIWDVGGASVFAPLECSPNSGAGGLPLRHSVEMMSLSPDGSRLAIVCADPSKENVRVIDVFTGRRMAVMGPAGRGGHDNKITAVAWSWDSSRIATSSDDLTVRVWYVGKPTAPPGNQLAAAAAIVAAEMSRDATPPLLPATPTPPPETSSSPSPSAPPWPRNRTLDEDMSASRHLVKLQSRTPSVVTDADDADGGGAEGAVAATAATANPAAAAAAADAAVTNGEIVFRPGQCQLILEGHHRKVQCVAWAHNGKKLASGGYDQMIRIWDTSTGEQLNLIYQVSWVSALAFSPDDARLVSGAGCRAVYMFNAATGKNLAGHAEPLPADASGGRTEVAGSRPATAGIAEVKGEGQGDEADPTASDSWIVAMRFNPDGTLLASRDMHSTVTLWDVSGMRLRPLRTLDGNFRDALFCPTSGDLQLYDMTASGALVMSAIPASSLPLGRAVQRAVTLSHPLLEFRGVAVDTAVNHNGVVLLTADNRAFFFVNGAHLAAVRQEASRAQRTPGSGSGGGSGGGGGRGWSVLTFGGGEQSAAVSRIPSIR
ncbi:hypothetical protein VaNZ11_009858 [Volvox africanus]|uniref:Nephrocystin 3-like N-terminal domain-containing protein n=1 Tax=Volvox africanus TaxID=51714 RepID=A0ABQ5S9F2_9CHLO|nr:hypothetical protein VaNZ11_009858 [Volvox africanus]